MSTKVTPGAIQPTSANVIAVDELVTRRGEVVATLGAVEPERVVAALVHADVPVRGFAVTTPSLEDLFVSLTGEGFDVSG